MNALFSFIFSLFLIVNPMAYGQSFTKSCKTLLNPTILDALHELNYTTELFSGIPLEIVQMQHGWLRQRTIRKILSRPMHDLKSRVQVLDIAADLTVALFGDKNLLDRWIGLENAEAVTRAEWQRDLYQDLISNGLIKFWKKNGGLAQEEQWMNSHRSWLHRLSSRPYFTHPIWNYLSIPIRLPTLTEESFAFKGFQDINRDKVQMAYSTFRRLWTPVFIGTLFAVQIHVGYVEGRQETQKDFEKNVHDIRDLRGGIKQLGISHRRKIWAAYRQSVQDFYKLWGDYPNTQEDVEIRAKFKIGPDEVE